MTTPPIATRIKSAFPRRGRPCRTLQQRYEAAAATWHVSIARLGYLDAYRLLARRVLTGETARAEQKLTVLDAGAGSAGFSMTFAQTAEHAPTLDILDPSPAMLRIAQANLAAAGIPARMFAGGIADGIPAQASYDVILCAHVVEHIADPVQALVRLRAALNPAGVLLLAASKPHWCTWILRRRWGHRAFTEIEMTRMLHQAGYRRVEPCPFVNGPPSRTSMGYLAFAGD